MEKLTLEKVKERLVSIEDSRQNDETAHCEEDELFYDFVNSIKNGFYDSKEETELIATEVYKVRDIKFSRWHA